MHNYLIPCTAWWDFAPSPWLFLLQHSSILVHNSVSERGRLSLGHHQSSASTRCGKEGEHLSPSFWLQSERPHPRPPVLSLCALKKGNGCPGPQKTKGFHSPPTPSCRCEFEQGALVGSAGQRAWRSPLSQLSFSNNIKELYVSFRPLSPSWHMRADPRSQKKCPRALGYQSFVPLYTNPLYIQKAHPLYFTRMPLLELEIVSFSGFTEDHSYSLFQNQSLYRTHVLVATEWSLDLRAWARGAVVGGRREWRSQCPVGVELGQAGESCRGIRLSPSQPLGWTLDSGGLRGPENPARVLSETYSLLLKDMVWSLLFRCCCFAGYFSFPEKNSKLKRKCDR